MYFKISLQNVKRNYRDYGVYFLTLMLAVALFYAFNTLGTQEAFLSATSNATKNLSMQLNSVMSVLSKVIAVVLAFLIIYANNFLLKRRKKELGIYMLLGMEHKNISKIFVLEVILVGIISFLLGITLGLFLSQIISILALKLFLFDLSVYQFTFSMKAFTDTFISFAIIFVIIMIFNVRVINKVTLIDLINANRKNETNEASGGGLIAMIFTASIVSLLSVVYFIYYKNGLSPNKGIFKFVALLGVLGTTGTIYTFYTVLHGLLKTNKRWYLKGINLFTIRQISSKINTNYITITLVSLLLTITIIITSLGMGIASAINTNSKEASPFDVSIYQDHDHVNLKKGESVVDHLSDNNIDAGAVFVNHFTVDLYKSSSVYYRDLIKDPSVLWPIDKELVDDHVPIMGLTAYNQILSYHGKNPITLSENQFLINCKYDGTVGIYKSLVDSKFSLYMNGLDLEVSPAIGEEVYFLSLVGMNDQGTIVVSDDMLKNFEPFYSIMNGNLKGDIDPEVFDNKLLDLITITHPYSYLTKTLMNVLYFGSIAMLAFICSYLGIIFLVISVAILSLQQLTEVSDNLHRYTVLKHIGVKRKHSLKSLYHQISVYFGTPLIVAALYAVVILPKLIEKVSLSLKLDISANVGLTGILFLCIYGSYFLITYTVSKKMIINEN